MAENREVSTIIVDGRGAEQGARQVNRAADQITQAGKKVEQAQVGIETAQRRTAESSRQQERALDRLTRAYAPVTAAAQKYARDQERLLGIVAGGGAHAERAAALLATMSREQGKAGTAAAKYGMQLQNAAFQAGDFFVQLASGTSAARAAAQQLPQLLGGFGVVGAVAGAAAAGLGALVPLLWDSGEAADASTKAVKTHADAVREAEDFIKRLNDETKDRTTLLREERDEVLKNARVEVEAAQTRLDAMLAEVQARNAFMTDPNADPMVETFIDYPAIQQQEEALKKASATFEELRKRIDGAVEGNIAFTEAEEGARRASQDHTAALDDLLRGYRDEIDLMGLSGREQAIVTATRQAHAAALDDFNAGLRDSPLLYQAEIDAIRQSVGALEDHRAEVKRQDDAYREAERAAKRHAEEMGRDACEYPDDVLEDPALAGMVKEALQ